MTFHVPNKYRIRTGSMGSDERNGNNGAFVIRLRHGQTVHAVASDGMGWEHVSVSRTDRPPLWDEMCQIKDMFWDGEDCVVQYHPPRSEYVNNHVHYLHMWRPIEAELPVPWHGLVGIRGAA
jgi:hypothetical protein